MSVRITTRRPIRLTRTRQAEFLMPRSPRVKPPCPNPIDWRQSPSLNILTSAGSCRLARIHKRQACPTASPRRGAESLRPSLKSRWPKFFCANPAITLRLRSPMFLRVNQSPCHPESRLLGRRIPAVRSFPRAPARRSLRTMKGVLRSELRSSGRCEVGAKGFQSSLAPAITLRLR